MTKRGNLPFLVYSLYLTLPHLFPLQLMVFSVSWNNFRQLPEEKVRPWCIKLWAVHDLCKVSLILDIRRSLDILS